MTFRTKLLLISSLTAAGAATGCTFAAGAANAATDASTVRSSASFQRPALRSRFFSPGSG